jgi:dTDP-4-amino-4,6-dideoxygalactose transaminase
VGGQPVGSFGAAAAFSLGTKKMVSGGTGGMLVTDSPDVFERAVLFGQPKPRAEQEVRSAALRRHVATGLGANLRGSPISAALALEHLERLPETIAVKAANLRLLDQEIAEHLPALRIPAPPSEWTAGSWYAYPCVWSDERINRDALVRALRAEGILIEHAADPLHRADLFSDPAVFTTLPIGVAGRSSPSLPGADNLAAHGVKWPTIEMYEPADTIIRTYGTALARVAARMDADDGRALLGLTAP